MNCQSVKSLAVSMLALLSLTSVDAFVPHSIESRSMKTATTSSTLAAHSGRMSCRPIGIGSAAPETRITNVDLEAVVDTSDEWIQTRTGIGSRHVLAHGEDLHQLAIKAGKGAIEMAGIDPSELDVVICASSSPDDMFGDAPKIAAALGCPTSTVAFDLSAACSGFLFASVTAGQFLSNDKPQKALVIGADSLSRWVDWEDRNVCILFGDGAGAMVLESTPSDKPEEAGILGYAARSNGAASGDLTLRYEGEPCEVATPGDGTTLSSGSFGCMSMNGKEVYKFATREVPTILTEALEAAEMTVDDIDWLLLHQANIRIMEAVAKRLGVPMEKVITNLNEYGNTSAASIPLALDEAVRNGQVKKGDVVACAGFGAGLSWGSAILKWGK